MLREGMTVRDATEAWVHEMNSIPQSIVARSMESDPDDWEEVTTPAQGDRVYVFLSDFRGNGEILRVKSGEEDGDEVTLYEIVLDDGSKTEAKADDFEVRYYDGLPMWGTMWTFGDAADNYWLEELGGIKAMSECGFRIYYNEDFGYVFGIDGAGYDFYEQHWIPLYLRRGLKFHDPRTETGKFFIPESRKAKLYKAMLDYFKNTFADPRELLHRLGFRDEEISYELGGSIDE